jgi:hypothetical protein
MSAPQTSYREGVPYPGAATNDCTPGYNNSPILSYPSLSGKIPLGSRSSSEEAAESITTTKRSRKKATPLHESFAWDQESLAVLCRWKDVSKRGSQAAVDAGIFPGHTKESLDHAWVTHRREARQAYRDVFVDELD